METENTNRPHPRRIAFIIFLSVCTLFIVYYTFMSVLAPGIKLEDMKKELNSEKADKKSGANEIYNDSTYLRLLKERAFLQSRVVLAQTDSIYLTINLADSSMNLEISGVVVHRAKIGSYKTSRMLMGNESIVLAMLAAPLTIASDLATIKKEPVMMKMAPKDTSEYKPDIMPDTSITEPVNYILEMSNGTRIYIYQIENTKRIDRMAQFKFDLNDRLHQTWHALKRVAVLKVPEYHPFLKIKLPRSDAKIIYRAIPKHGQIALII